VLISKTGTAQVCDYGLSPIISNPTFVATIGSSRWLAPEIIDPPSSNPSTASKSADVFAFAMLAVEVFTGVVPFGNMTEGSVAVQIADGGRPVRPQAAERLGLTVEMWKFIEKCWTANPRERPTIDEVVRTWEGFVSGHVEPSSGSPASQRRASRVPGRRSQFEEFSTVSAERRGGHSSPRNLHTHGPTCCEATTPLHKRRFCGLF
jgi:serine/threonine protein kinase